MTAPADPHAEARLQERLEELAAATIRAMTGERDLAFRGRRLHRGGRRLPRFAPHVEADAARDDLASFRGAADGLALRLARSDDALHRALAPADAVERLLFDWFEQFRAESLVPEAWPGVRANLRHRHETWSLGFHDAGHTESAAGLLLYTAVQVVRARVTAEPVVEATEDLMEATRFALAPRLGQALAALRRARHDQRAFAVAALAIAAEVALMLREAGGSSALAGSTGSAADTQADADAKSVFGLRLDDDRDEADGGEDGTGAAVRGAARMVDAAAADRYRVFTTAYDREEDATALARPDELDALRERLDRRLAAQAVNVPRLARALLRLFATPADDGFDPLQEEGQLDGRAIARLIAAPADHRVFRRVREAPVADVALTLLLDCSGSMKAHAETVAVLADTLARAAEQAGLAAEVLGYSTGAWNGGRAARDWRRAGRPASPGRVAERLHIVFKPFDRPWRRARRGLAALLKPEPFREGLDGEALAWAASRLAAHDARRRVIVVVSDGSPMETASALANGADWLDRHLAAVADGIERRSGEGRIELHALGVGLDLSPCYRSSHLLDLDAAIGNAMFGELLDLLARR